MTMAGPGGCEGVHTHLCSVLLVGTAVLLGSIKDVKLHSPVSEAQPGTL